MGRILRFVVAGVSSALCVLSLGCGSGALTPTISQVLPRTIVVGAPTQTIQVVGTNFGDQPVILWNGNAVLTKVVNAATLSGTVDSNALTNPGTAQVQVLDSAYMQRSLAVPVTVAARTTATQGLAITTSALGAGTPNSTYSQALQAIGGAPGYTWSIASGQLPAGVTLTPSTGLITGVPTTSGSSTFTVTVADSSVPVQTQSNVYSIVIGNVPLAITSSTLSPAISGTTYSQTLQASGGTPSYRWTISSGNLPAGLTLASNGTISGTPIVSGTFNFTATVTDSSSPAQSQSATASIVVGSTSTPLSITSSNLASAPLNASYSQTLQASGGTPGYSWTITSGSLPTGLTFASNGTISGTPTVSGTSNFAVTVTDSSSPAQSKSANASIIVGSAPLSITSSSLASAPVNSSYSQTLGASGGTPGYSWNVTSGSLPAGLTLAAASGTISGTPTASGTFNFTVTVTDSSSPAQSKSAITSIVVGSTSLNITSSSFVAATLGAPYSQPLQASGGTPAYTWFISAGNLPTGLTLSPATGVISGTATATGTYPFTVGVTDNSSPAQTKSAATSLTVGSGSGSLSIAQPSFAAAAVGTSYSQTLQASGGTPGYNWTITNGNLPSGLSLTGTSGVISGTPTAAGTFSFTATVTDSSSPVQSKSVSTSIVVAPTALTVATPNFASASPSSSYSQTLQASGGTPGYSWTITSGSLPGGLSLASNGVISGTPTASGTFNFTATVTDSGSPAQSKSLSTSISVSGSSLAITSSTLAAGTTGTTYSQTFQASGGTPGYNWTIPNGNLPAGLTLAASTGTISGTPTATGTFSFSVTVTDSSSPAQSKSATTSIVIAGASASLKITSSTFVSGTNGAAFSQTLTASGGIPAYNWTITSGSLPAGLTLAATSGVVSGTPTATGTSNFTVTVTDNSTPAQTASATTSIVVAAPAPTGPGTTWYIRPDGGTRYSPTQLSGQCDGKSDSPYLGSGTNQHCAFGDYRFLWDDQSWGGYNNWAIAGGDTVIIRGGPWRVGFNQGTSAYDVWCAGSGDPYSCSNPAIPSGSASQHTRILGENYASCSSGTATDRTKLTQIFGGFGVGTAFNLTDTQYVDVACIEITRHSQCTRSGVPSYPSGCNTSMPLDDYDTHGVATSNKTANVTMTDIWIHGHTSRGVIGPIGGPVTCLRCNVSFNGMAGWDFDDGRATPYGPGAVWNFLYSTIEWNGCNQEYPITHAIPAISCYSQSTGGYGDGVGSPTGTGTGMSVVVDHSIFRYNTQDGLDMLHLDSGTNTLSVTNSQSYSNNGQSYKLGANFQNVTFTNNLAVNNCLRMSQPVPGAPSTFNAHLGDFCRAADAVPMNLLDGSNVLFANNTIVTYAPTTYDIACVSPNCPNSTLTFENNISIGYDNPGTYNMGGQNGGPGDFYMQEPIGHVIRNHNIWYGFRNIHPSTCPTGEICLDPGLVNEPAGNGAGFVESELDNYNFTPASASPAIGAGLAIPAVTLDYNGATRPTPPTIGAIE